MEQRQTAYRDRVEAKYGQRSYNNDGNDGGADSYTGEPRRERDRNYSNNNSNGFDNNNKRDKGRGGNKFGSDNKFQQKKKPPVRDPRIPPNMRPAGSNVDETLPVTSIQDMKAKVLTK